MRYTSRYLIVPVFLVLQACTQITPQWNREMPYEPDRAPEIGDILHTASGHYVSRQAFYDSLNFYPLIYVGEVHDNPASHRLELDILREIQNRNPGGVSLGMEMFNIEQQPALDRWVAGELDIKTFLRESRWYENWGGDFELYREILEYCRDNQVPVIGLNTTKSLGRKISMTPLAKLDEATRAQLPEMDMNDPYQSAMVKQIFGAHGAGATMLESFSRRQTLWDETMAQSVADYLGDKSDHRMVVMAGGWHVNYGFGIPRRVHRRLPLPYVLVGEHHLEVPEEKRDQLMDVTLPEFPMRRVDYLVYLDYEIFTPRGVRLGVVLDDSGEQDGLLITEVVDGSAASAAGIQTGDRLIRIDGLPLKENYDLIYALKNRHAGGQASIELLRENKPIVIEVHFIDSKKKHP